MELTLKQLRAMVESILPYHLELKNIDVVAGNSMEVQPTTFKAIIRDRLSYKDGSGAAGYWVNELTRRVRAVYGRDALHVEVIEKAADDAISQPSLDMILFGLERAKKWARDWARTHSEHERAVERFIQKLHQLGCALNDGPLDHRVLIRSFILFSVTPDPGHDEADDSCQGSGDREECNDIGKSLHRSLTGS